MITKTLIAALTIILLVGCHQQQSQAKVAQARPNIIFILTDDQRYDELGVVNPILNTPHLDAMAHDGVRFENAFVTTSLCSPSRATILTGQYTHNHGVVDNNKAGNIDKLSFFPEYLQQGGYQTAFIGKWHMGGHGDDPQPGFDYWLSFKGQGNYTPVDVYGNPSLFNINGEHVQQKGYITDELTDYSIQWLESTKSQQKPFMLYLSHKAVHSIFTPAERHKDLYQDVTIPVPVTQPDSAENRKGKPMWVINQRNSYHGVDYPYHGIMEELMTGFNVQEFKRRYHQAIAAVDDSVGKIRQWLVKNQLSDNTYIIFMGDNGFMFGEHGLIDKRNAYEESIRVPMLIVGPTIKKNSVMGEIVANLDIAPTILDIAGLASPQQFEGQSYLPIASGETVQDWRTELLYEYYWEFNYPHTPTTFALRGQRYKLIQYHGVWDTEELYDIQNDPLEQHNLIDDESLTAIKVEMRRKLFAQLANNKGEHTIPYTEKYNSGAVYKGKGGPAQADAPSHWYRQLNGPDANQHEIPDGPGKAAKVKAYKEI
ncbi:sulfatase [Paraferrimonas sp. SM1919]|uniref:sulfatase family protein n=1 Tax=Paraferrimonas sp. SM1919 TaxID=2662263 RepID=UPI0013D7F795|nr:sulfatase [Paraferrimonas sp. SM1919]